LTTVLIFLASPTFSWYRVFTSYTFTATGLAGYLLKKPTGPPTPEAYTYQAFFTATFLRCKTVETDFSFLKSRADPSFF